MGVTTANATVTLETDLTSQFSSLTNKDNWTFPQPAGNSGYTAEWACPLVHVNDGIDRQVIEHYMWSCEQTGDIFYTTVTGLTAGTYKIELYGGAAFTFERGFGSTAFTGDLSVDKSTTYQANQKIEPSGTVSTGVTLYAISEGVTYGGEIPIYYAQTFPEGAATVTLNNVLVGSSGQIKIGMSKTSTSTNWHVIQLKGVTATVDGETVINNLKANANALLGNATYKNVVGQERINLMAAVAATPLAETAESYEAVISALNTAISAFENCDVAAYNALAAEVTKAYALGMFTKEQAEAYLAEHASELTAALCPTYTKEVMVQEYNYVTTNYSHGVGLGTWTTVNATERSGQHWDGTSTSTYSEQNTGWGDKSWSCSYSQDLTLPAGKYVFKVAGRKSSNDAVLTLTVKNGETVIGTVNDFPNGDTGFGINTSGVTDFSSESTYAQKDGNNTGRGWQWRYVAFELADPATVNVAVTASVKDAQYQWVGFCNATVQTDNADNVALMEALVALNSAKTTATLTKNNNAGTGVFQLDEETNNNLWGAYETAKENAENYTLTSTSTVDEINGLVTALSTAISDYSYQALNAPDADKRYNVSIVEEGKDWNGNAITFIAGARSDAGLYGIKYLAPANANLNQALKFTAVEGYANTYKVSAINAETGEEQYITTGSTYEGGNNSQIRTTDDATKASWVKIQATTTNGEFQLLNVSDGNKVIANNNNNDMYTAGAANFTIAEASEATVSISIDDDVKLATRIFPFTATLPEGVKAFSCDGVNEGVLELTEVVTLEANVPYILYAREGYQGDALTGWGTGSATENPDAGRYLTGVYVDTPAPENSWVLQKQDGDVSFYKVGENQPTVGANRAYLTPEGQSTARLSFPFEDELTAINAIKAMTSGKVEIYNVSGAKLPALQKGMNILKTNDGRSLKVMVK